MSGSRLWSSSLASVPDTPSLLATGVAPSSSFLRMYDETRGGEGVATGAEDGTVDVDGKRTPLDGLEISEMFASDPSEPRERSGGVPSD
jgi:hypothetical protein